MTKLRQVVMGALGAFGPGQEVPKRLTPATTTSTFHPGFSAATAPATFTPTPRACPKGTRWNGFKCVHVKQRTRTF